MAEAIVILERRRAVFGHLRVVSASQVIFGASGDTWHVPGIRRIEQINLAPNTPDPFAFIVNDNVVALNAPAGVAFRGSVVGI